jgi:heat shock protein HslJ
MAQAAILVVVLAFAVGACDATGSSPSTSAEPTPAGDLAGTTWLVAAIGGTQVSLPEPPRIEFGSEGQIAGSTGCNSMTGTYAVDGASLSFGPLATTKRACEAPHGEIETMLLDALAGVSGWEVGGDGLLRLTGGTEVVLAPIAP